MKQKYIVVFKLKPGTKYKMSDAFEKRGPDHTSGVFFQNAWLGAKSDVVFVLCESPSEAALEEACNRWQEFGEHEIHPVIGIEQL